MKSTFHFPLTHFLCSAIESLAVRSPLDPLQPTFYPLLHLSAFRFSLFAFSSPHLSLKTVPFHPDPKFPWGFLTLKTNIASSIFKDMEGRSTNSLRKLQSDFAPFCRKYGIMSLAVFGSVARGDSRLNSDLDLLADLSTESTTADILEMAGEAEEVAGRPVDFVLRSSLRKAPDQKRSDHILSTAVFLYGS